MKLVLGQKKEKVLAIAPPPPAKHSAAPNMPKRIPLIEYATSVALVNLTNAKCTGTISKEKNNGKSAAIIIAKPYCARPSPSRTIGPVAMSAIIGLKTTASS
ncbi:hypothetical protein PVT67_05265 [Gallaecimonas kandeliae]|uniref:hypothetical protein n=1 Tax=Gallaecimonas kandeliae TaxID=3029055 RepID=UPI00264872A6|nr:hypothetical protein [Gallaecimonas kandeliae]WKE66655.1 hypothetical protein PVT67_05265 [Gallaecimonas kandeliae]